MPHFGEKHHHQHYRSPQAKGTSTRSQQQLNRRPHLTRIQGKINLMNGPNSDRFAVDDRPTLRDSTFVVDNMSMISVMSKMFHENSGDDDFSTYEYSLGAPSYFNSAPSLRNLSPEDKAANHNLSQYFGRSTRLCADYSDNDTQEEDSVCFSEDIEEGGEDKESLDEETLDETRNKDDILGSLRLRVPDKAAQPVQMEKASGRRSRDYADKLLGLGDDSTSHETTSTIQSDEFGEPTKTKKKRWFGGRVFKKKGGNDKHEKSKNRAKASLQMPPSKTRARPARMASF
ncbi:expressed unknown protein [Seminavis robusta]|uniref:Uncharacterized protein n=1 Tax=Seminavis robusta TaxID=568900 RepID=A0A9N8HS51_9STRA|nr:expressed unknown protein [Seminavis robusta]|eukprot:Sro1669_g289930.1 n/a (287) ;mRNA; f:12949-13809